MTERVERQDLRALDLAEERQRKITGNAEDFVRAVVLECVQERVREFHDHSPPRRMPGQHPWTDSI